MIGTVEFLTSDERQLALSPQIVREYVAVATRSVDVNGLGLSGEERSPTSDSSWT